MSRNSVWYPVVLFATIRLGAVVCPLASSSSTQELSYAFSKIKPKVIFVDFSNHNAVTQACYANNILVRSIFSLDSSTSNVSSLPDLISEGKSCDGSVSINKYKIPPTVSN
jgi:acyl-CoA synthetase (AMP-forming)/AMP-acid ligase II